MYLNELVNKMKEKKGKLKQNLTNYLYNNIFDVTNQLSIAIY